VTTALKTRPITVREAARKYRLRENLIHLWLYRKHLHAIDRLPFPARGGGKVLIDEAELLERVNGNGQHERNNPSE